jgi:hypothetical protein
MQDMDLIRVKWIIILVAVPINEAVFVKGIRYIGETVTLCIRQHTMK